MSDRSDREGMVLTIKIEEVPKWEPPRFYAEIYVNDVWFHTIEVDTSTDEGLLVGALAQAAKRLRDLKKQGERAEA